MFLSLSCQKPVLLDSGRGSRSMFFYRLLQQAIATVTAPRPAMMAGASSKDPTASGDPVECST